MQPLDRSLHAALRGRALAHEFPTFRDAAAFAPDLLPLYLGFGAFIGLREDGELLSVAWESPHDQELVREPLWRRVAIVAGAEEYSELGYLVPRRPPEALACPICDGTGRPTVNGREVPSNIRCMCGGLGWLLPGEAEQATRP